MKTLKINAENAVKAYDAADKNQKSFLEILFGKDIFIKKDIMDRIRSFDDVCTEMGKNPDDYKITSTDPDEIAANALRQILLITRCFNQGKEADWANSSQYKYFVYYKFSPGSGWSYCGYGDWGASTIAGARLAFLNSDHAAYCGKQFSEIYTNYFK